MKIIKSVKDSLKLLAASLLLIVGATSCESIYDKTQDCDTYYYLRFVYDMNMDYADAFASKVESVDVYVFDSESGYFVDKFSESGEELKRDNYRMCLYLRPGNYEFVAWCGLAENEDHFTVPEQVNRIQDLRCRMDRTHDEEGTATQNVLLYNLFHGKLTAELPDEPGDHLYTINLIKDTNNINFSIQEVNNLAIKPEDYIIKMHASNGFMDYDNSLLDDEEIVYRPYRKVSGTASVDETRADEYTNVILAEMSSSRLVATHNPTIDVIEVNSGKTIYSVPLVKWALMLKSEQYSQMANQEYLDREDEFNVVLYINAQKLVAVEIMINGWHMVINSDAVLGQ